MKTALELLNDVKSKPRYVSFGCPILDHMTGGLVCCGITEISGSAGSGKTQLALSLSVNTCLVSEKSFVAYLSCGEGEFPIRRLQQMTIESLKQNQPDSVGTEAEILSRVLIESNIYSSDDLISVLHDSVLKLCQSKDIRLVIIDSIAGIVRSEFDNNRKSEMYTRASIFFKLATQMKWLADTFNVAVLVINQVTSSMTDDHKDAVIPALGLTWSHCLNTRISLHRVNTNFEAQPLNSLIHKNMNENMDQVAVAKHSTSTTSSNDTDMESNASRSKAPVQRLMTIEFSPWKSNQSCYFEIVPSGVRGVV